MTTRTSQPAGGALLISEMKEFASFPKATQRYIRRSLDVAYGRSRPDRDLGPRRDRGRGDPRPGPLLQAARPSSPADPGRQRPRHDRAVPGHAGHAGRVRPGPGPAARISPPSASFTSGCSARASGRGCRRRSAPPRPCRTSTPTAAAILLQSISESAATAPGWSTREPVFWPEWVEKVDSRRRRASSRQLSPYGKISRELLKAVSRILVMDEDAARALPICRDGRRGRRPARRRPSCGDTCRAPCR